MFWRQAFIACFCLLIILPGFQAVFPPEARADMFKFHHLGIIVNDMDSSVSTLCRIIGISTDDERIDRFTGKENKTTMLPLGREEDFNYFEVMQLINQPWPDNYFKGDMAEGVFHIVFLVDNWDERVSRLQAQGFTVNIQETPYPFEGCELLREAYVMPKNETRGVLIDLIDADHFPESLGGLAPASLPRHR